MKTATDGADAEKEIDSLPSLKDSVDQLLQGTGTRGVIEYMDGVEYTLSKAALYDGYILRKKSSTREPDARRLQNSYTIYFDSSLNIIPSQVWTAHDDAYMPLLDEIVCTPEECAHVEKVLKKIIELRENRSHHKFAHARVEINSLAAHAMGVSVPADHRKWN